MILENGSMLRGMNQVRANCPFNGILLTYSRRNFLDGLRDFPGHKVIDRPFREN
jgi:hypothetical protein